MGWVTLSRAVASAGTAVKLSDTSKQATVVLVQCKSSNTGKIFFGGTSTLANDESDGAPYREAGEPFVYSHEGHGSVFYDLKDIWINAETSGEGVNILYWAP